MRCQPVRAIHAHCVLTASHFRPHTRLPSDWLQTRVSTASDTSATDERDSEMSRAPLAAIRSAGGRLPARVALAAIRLARAAAGCVAGAAAIPAVAAEIPA